MSIESHLVSLRTYLEEISSQNKAILAKLEERGEKPYPAQKTTDAFLKAVTQDVLGKQADSDAATTEQHAPRPDKAASKPAAKPQTAAAVEQQLEAETGKDFVKTGSDPVTLAESDKPAPKKASK
jgi:hypothetical protein